MTLEWIRQVDTCGPDTCRLFGDVKNRYASPGVRGNIPSPNIARIGVTLFAQDVVIRLRMVPIVLCRCSIVIGRSIIAARIAENMGNAFACRQIEVAQERRYTHADTLQTTEWRGKHCCLRSLVVGCDTWYAVGGSLLKSAIIASSSGMDITDT